MSIEYEDWSSLDNKGFIGISVKLTLLFESKGLILDDFLDNKGFNFDLFGVVDKYFELFIEEFK